jgi:hypothetical protein
MERQIEQRCHGGEDCKEGDLAAEDAEDIGNSTRQRRRHKPDRCAGAEQKAELLGPHAT